MHSMPNDSINAVRSQTHKAFGVGSLFVRVQLLMDLRQQPEAEEAHEHCATPQRDCVTIILHHQVQIRLNLHQRG